VTKKREGGLSDLSQWIVATTLPVFCGGEASSFPSSSFSSSSSSSYLPSASISPLFSRRFHAAEVSEAVGRDGVESKYFLACCSYYGSGGIGGRFYLRLR
ncbi:hypothetical protein GW17_00054213, partial [Ensete ventricosum]